MVCSCVFHARRHGLRSEVPQLSPPFFSCHAPPPTSFTLQFRKLQYQYVKGGPLSLLEVLNRLLSYPIGGGLEDRVAK